MRVLNFLPKLVKLAWGIYDWRSWHYHWLDSLIARVRHHHLDRKWQDFCDMLGRDPAERRHGRNAFRYIHVDKFIASSNDYKDWRQHYAPLRILRKDRQNGRIGPRRKKENYHYFKPASERKWNVSYLYTYLPFGGG